MTSITNLQSCGMWLHTSSGFGSHAIRLRSENPQRALRSEGVIVAAVAEQPQATPSSSASANVKEIRGFLGGGIQRGCQEKLTKIELAFCSYDTRSVRAGFIMKKWLSPPVTCCPARGTVMQALKYRPKADWPRQIEPPKATGWPATYWPTVRSPSSVQVNPTLFFF